MSGAMIGDVVEETSCGESPCNAGVMFWPPSSPAPALGSRSMSLEFNTNEGVTIGMVLLLLGIRRGTGLGTSGEDGLSPASTVSFTALALLCRLSSEEASLGVGAREELGVEASFVSRSSRNRQEGRVPLVSSGGSVSLVDS